MADDLKENMYYIAGRIADEKQFAALRDEVYLHANAAVENYTKRKPHITFLNRIKLPIKNEQQVREAANALNSIEIKIQPETLSVWPSLRQPRYITVNAHSPIKPYQKMLTEIIKSNDGEVLVDAPSPHITLLKTTDPHTVSNKTKKKLQSLIQTTASQQLQLETEISYLDLLDSQLEPEPTTEHTTVLNPTISD